MAKKITKQDFAHIETSDAAFNQMMANLPNIDIWKIRARVTP